MGGGAGLTAACDLVLCSREATFSLPEVMVGMIPALIAPFLLRRMSLARVRYLALSSRRIGAEEAREYGLVDQVATEGMQKALEAQLQRLFCSAPAALSQVKEYFDRLDGSDFHQQRQAAADELDQWLGRPRVLEGVRTFAQGFSPQWFEKYRENNDGHEDPH
jgi:methylglutaconyl-CoA hydratase/polyketide biosynthesis enoyl-CoA hydratase PksH